MAVDYYLKLDGIKGEAQTKGKENQIHVRSPGAGALTSRAPRNSAADREPAGSTWAM